MLYPVYVHHGDDGHAHGATVYDFPGCFSAADNWSDLPHRVQEAVEVYCNGEEMDIPEPTPLESLIHHADYEGGTWAMIDVDVDKLDTRKERVNLTIPRNALREIDQYAQRHNMKRSAFMVAAALKEARGG